MPISPRSILPAPKMQYFPLTAHSLLSIRLFWIPLPPSPLSFPIAPCSVPSFSPVASWQWPIHSSACSLCPCPLYHWIDTYTILWSMPSFAFLIQFEVALGRGLLLISLFILALDCPRLSVLRILFTLSCY